jgi:peptidoglycan/xylan/chitin deacetylase (PgdA/CDA1 family)
MVVARDPALGGADGYVAMVRELARQGYTCVSFPDFAPDRRDFLLRHDVDADLESAVAMARLNRLHGWHATFFILPHTGPYDPGSAAGRNALKAIAECGHDIGLHFDPKAHGDIADLDNLVASECDRLAQILGRPVSLVAPHQPAKACPDWLGWDHRPGGRLQAYHPRFFRDAGYVSDSAGYWAYGHPLDHPKVAAGQGLQVLTHPHLWGVTKAES